MHPTAAAMAWWLAPTSRWRTTGWNAGPTKPRLLQSLQKTDRSASKGRASIWHLQLQGSLL